MKVCRRDRDAVIQEVVEPPAGLTIDDMLHPDLAKEYIGCPEDAKPGDVWYQGKLYPRPDGALEFDHKNHRWNVDPVWLERYQAETEWSRRQSDAALILPDLLDNLRELQTRLASNKPGTVKEVVSALTEALAPLSEVSVGAASTLEGLDNLLDGNMANV